jgi:glutathione S-transferase
LIAEDGAALVESSVVLDYLASRFPAVDALKPKRLPAYRALGAALTVMEKAVQIHYERDLRKEGERSDSWRARALGQLGAGLAALEKSAPENFYEASLGHADVAAVCAWGFVRGAIGDVIAAADYPGLAAFAARAEALPEFRAAPAQDGVRVEAMR